MADASQDQGRPGLQRGFAPQQMIEGALVAESIKINLAIQEHDAFVFQQFFLPAKTGTVFGQ